jgi:hypothetical protein
MNGIVYPACEMILEIFYFDPRITKCYGESHVEMGWGKEGGR